MGANSSTTASYMPLRAVEAGEDSAVGGVKPTSKLKIALIIAAFFICCIAALVLCKEYLGTLLLRISHLNHIVGPILIIALFIAVSFPMMWGYIVLNLASGYLYGFWEGFLITSFGASLGAIISLLVCRLFLTDYVARKLSGHANFQQILRVIEGRQGFRIIVMVRLSPLPFGMQNTLLSASGITKTRYALATFLGLLPTQALNTYMGTSLHSIEDVMAGKNSNVYVFVAQVFLTVAITFLVNMKMKEELRKLEGGDNLQDNSSVLGAKASLVEESAV